MDNPGNCTQCGEKLVYTGEMQPKNDPNRFYACSNKHVVLLLHCTGEPDWGDHSVTRAWREAFIYGGSKELQDEYEFYGNHRS